MAKVSFDVGCGLQHHPQGFDRTNEMATDQDILSLDIALNTGILA